MNVTFILKQNDRSECACGWESNSWTLVTYLEE